MAEALDCGSNYESSILSGHPILLRARLTASRRPLKPAFEVQFLGPQPLAAGAIGGASDSDSEGSRFEAWAASQFLRVSLKGQDGTLRTFRLGFDSSYPYQVLRPVVQSHRTQRSERCNWGWNPHWSTRFRGVGRLVRHLIVDQG